MIRNNNNRRRRGGGNNGGPRPQQMNGGGGNYGNRLDNRQRGNASQLLEKYKAMARDAQQAGDRVATEYYLQFAEHYYRMLGDYRDRQPEQNRPQRGQNFFDDDGGDGQFDGQSDDDGGEEGQEQDDWNNRRPPEQARQSEARQQNDRQQNDRQQNDRQQAQPNDRDGDSRGQQNARAPERTNDRRDPQGGREQRDGRSQQSTRPNGYQNDSYQGGERRPYRDNGVRSDAGETGRSDYNERPADDRPDDGRVAHAPRGERREWQPRPPRDATPREPEPVEAANGIAGLPGPARLSVTSSEPMLTVESPTPEAVEAAPKRRGRPRKIVAEAPVEG